jgi:predicted nucleotidyltransferase
VPPRPDGIIGPVPSGPPLLAGIVGSTAYGLAHAGSDVDRIGMYAAPTSAFLRIHGPEETYRAATHDQTWHEARKFVLHAMAGNPTLTELLWLPADLYETLEPLGGELIAVRGRLLCARAVRDAYLGYAVQQFRRLENRGDGSFSSDTRKRTAKHARHMWRLIVQGIELHRTGRLRVRLAPWEAEDCREFGEAVATNGHRVAKTMLADADQAFTRYRSPLPASPDYKTAEAWLLNVREAYYDAAA